MLTSRKMSGGDDLSTKFFTYKMTIDFDMLGAFMKNWIVGDVKSSLIITVELHRLRMRYTKVLKKQLKPKKFTSGGATSNGTACPVRIRETVDL